MSVCRFNFVLPGIDPQALTGYYKAGIEMMKYADDNGFFSVSFEEHHGADNGWSPTPLTNAAFAVAATKNVRIIIQALLCRCTTRCGIAEQIAVLDLASGGRVSTVAGLGYRPLRVRGGGQVLEGPRQAARRRRRGHARGVDRRAVRVRRHTIRVTPKPITPPQPLLFIGGTGRPGARRAARFGLPFLPAANLPELEAYYYEQCAERGVHPFIMMPPEDTAMLHIAEDPDKAWAEYGKYFLHEATTYASWQTPDIKSAVHSHATTAEELRKEGIYQVLTPDQCVERAKEQGDFAAIVLHPMVGGMPPEVGWESLHLYVDKVLPQLA